MKDVGSVLVNEDPGLVIVVVRVSPDVVTLIDD